MPDPVMWHCQIIVSCRRLSFSPVDIPLIGIGCLVIRFVFINPLKEGPLDATYGEAYLRNS